MIHLIVTYCLVLNPTQCRSLEMVPDNYRPITSMTDCMMGGVIGGTKFVLDHAEWQVKGFHCNQEDVEKDTWLR